jgi:hypothetical protein
MENPIDVPKSPPEETKAKIYSINAFVKLIKEKLKSQAKIIIVLFKLDSVKMSSIGSTYFLPLVYKLDSKIVN